MTRIAATKAVPTNESIGQGAFSSATWSEDGNDSCSKVDDSEGGSLEQGGENIGHANIGHVEDARYSELRQKHEDREGIARIIIAHNSSIDQNCKASDNCDEERANQADLDSEPVVEDADQSVSNNLAA